MNANGEKPIVIHPKGYRSNDGNINVGESLLDCYWAIIESNGCRTINFLISATKSISEGEGPAFSMTAPFISLSLYRRLMPTGENASEHIGKKREICKSASDRLPP